MNPFTRLSLAYVALAALVLLPLHATAATFLQQEEGNVTVSTPIENDAYIFGNRIDVDAAISEDALIFGQFISIGSPIGQDLFSAGQTIEVTAPVQDDAHLAGNAITVRSSVDGDIFAAGQSLTLTEASSIADDAYLTGQSVTIAGTISGTARIAAESVTIEPTARITGDLITYGNRPTIAEGAVISGEQRHEAREEVQPRRESQSILAGWVRSVLSLAVLGLILVYIFPRFTNIVLERTRQYPAKSLGVGALWMILVWPVSILLIFTIIGIPLAFTLLFLSIIFYIVGAGYAGLLIGSWLMGKISSQQPLSWAHVLLGAAVYESIQLLGFLGWLVTFVFVLMALGGFIRTLWLRSDNRHEERIA